MKRAIFVTAGTVAGVLAALNYTPTPPDAGDVSAAGLGSLTDLGASTPVVPAAPGGSGAKPPAAAVGAPATAAAPAAPAAGTTAKPATAAPPATGTKPAATAPKPLTPTGAAPLAKPATAKPTTAAPKPTNAPKPTTAPKPAPAPTKTTAPKPKPKPPPPKPTPTPTPTKANGDFMGAAVRTGVYGQIQVQIRVQAGVVTDIAIPVYPKTDPKSVTLSAQALPMLRQEALAAQSAKIAVVSGASYTSNGFIASLATALKAAGL